MYIEIVRQSLARLEAHLTGKSLKPEPAPKRARGRPQIYESKRERDEAQEIRRKAKAAIAKRMKRENSTPKAESIVITVSPS